MIQRAVAAGDELDLVDEQDRPIGVTTRAAVRAGNLWHRTVAVLCVNATGQLYVQRRTDEKDLFPGLYDMFTSGCVDAGEGYDAAAIRELGEELGVHNTPVEPLFKHRYDGAETRTHTWVYRARTEGPFVHQASEVAWGGFMDPDRVLANPEGLHYVPDGAAHFAELVRRGHLRD